MYFKSMVTLSLLSMFGTVAALAVPVSELILTQAGGSKYYLLASTSTDSRALARKGTYQPVDVYLVPKTIKLNYSLLNGGKMVQLWFPGPNAYESDADPNGLMFPKGANLESLSAENHQAVFVVKPQFLKFIRSLDADTKITYRDDQQPNGFTQVKLSVFSLDRFLSAASYSHSVNKKSYLTLVKSSAFTHPELTELLQSFEVRLPHIITAIEPKEVTYEFPAASDWLNETVKPNLSFYHAFELIDRDLIPWIAKDGGMKELSQAVGEEYWKRDFLNQALDYFFDVSESDPLNASSCRAYRVQLRAQRSPGQYKTAYYTPRLETLTLPFVPFLLEGNR